VFVLNENGKLHKQLEKTRPYADLVDVVVADGGSTDRSTAPDQLKPLGVNTLLVKTGLGRLGAQMRMAFAWALDRDYRGVICIDGNNKDGPEAIPRFLHKLEADYDHVQGSRFLPGGVSENLPLSRWFGLKFLHAPLIRLASGCRYTDTTNGFRGYSRRLLLDPKVAVFRDVFEGYELHYYLAIRAAQLGFKVCEVPVARRYPCRGAVPTKISLIRGNLQVLRCLFRACLGRYNT
jgi:dolichol-phosphate mannosyltransferase